MKSLQPAHRKPFWSALLLSLGAGGARLADLLLYTDAASGFARGPVLPRCAALLVVVALFRVAAAFTAPRPVVPPRSSGLLAAALAAAAPCAVLTAGAGAAPAMWLLCAAAGAGLLWLAFRAAKHVGIAAPALLLAPWLLYVAALRALAAPAAIARMGAVVRVLSVVAALAFFTALLRWLYLPAQPGVPTLFTAGFACFTFGTCMELPQTAYGYAMGTASLQALATAGAFGCLGLAGLLCAWQATGPNLVTMEFPASQS